MSAERRRNPRVTVDVPVKVKAVLDAMPIDGRLRDISVDATLVEAEASWDIGTEVILDLDLPDHGGPLSLNGTVIRIVQGEKDGMSHGMAVLFTDLPPAAATSIDLFLAAQ